MKNKISLIETKLESLSGEKLDANLLDNVLNVEEKSTEFIKELSPVNLSQQNTEIVKNDEDVDNTKGSFSEEGKSYEESLTEEVVTTGKPLTGEQNNEQNNEDLDNTNGSSSEETKSSVDSLTEEVFTTGEQNNEQNNEDVDNTKGSFSEESKYSEESLREEVVTTGEPLKGEQNNENNKVNTEDLQVGKGLNNEEPPKKGFFSKIFSLIGGAKDYDSDSSEIVTSFFSDNDDDDNDDQFSLASFEKMYDNQTYLFDEADSDEESLIDNAMRLKDKKYLNSLNVGELRSIMKNNNLQVSKKGSYLKKNEMIKVIKKNII